MKFIKDLKAELEFSEIFKGEYYFQIGRKLQKVLNPQFSDIGFQFVNAVVYNPKTKQLKAECFYVFNVSYHEFENEEIKVACKELFEEIKK